MKTATVADNVTDSPFFNRVFALGELRKADLLEVLRGKKPDHDYTMRDTRYDIILAIVEIEFPEGASVPPAPPAPPPTDEERDYARVNEAKVAQLVAGFFAPHDHGDVYIFHPEFGEEYMHTLDESFAVGNAFFMMIDGQTFRLTVTKEGYGDAKAHQ